MMHFIWAILRFWPIFNFNKNSTKELTLTSTIFAKREYNFILSDDSKDTSKPSP